MGDAKIPLVTYRFQLHAGFPLREATALLPYLKALGVSHVYCSPLLQATPGSTHGYDCANHQKLNQEIASDAEFETFVTKVRELQMSVLLDIVPNHAALHRSNPTLMDVLENGQSSIYAHVYDINWNAHRFGLANKLLLPVLGTHLASAVESGEIKLCWSDSLRTAVFTYYSWTFPADPVAVARFLLRPAALSEPIPHALLDPLRHLAALPTPAEGGSRKRQSLLPLYKESLASAVSCDPSVKATLEQRLALSPTDMLSLLSDQPYRLAYWRTASSEVNYRRFFDINELIALRVEDQDVFDQTHALIRKWVTQGTVAGLRVDHPDGLANPKAYFERLQTFVAANAADSSSSSRNAAPRLYVVAEKILSSGEEWQREWPTHGTTGYEFMNVLTGVFVDTRAEETFTERWRQLSGINLTWSQMARHCKRLVLKRNFESDLCRIAETLQALLICMGPPRDWTISQIKRALLEYIAALPVYRTYVQADGVASSADLAFIQEAVKLAAQRKGVERELLPAIAAVFSTPPPTGGSLAAREHADLRKRFVTQLQQLTGAVMAKGCEDTAFYRYLRLTALNEVGGDPGQFGTSLETFHKFHIHRATYWPHALSSVSTHDTKRGSDARLRLAVLSEMPDAWFRAVQQWIAMNRSLKDGSNYPAANEEQFLYQTLLCAWGPEETSPSPDFVDRIEAYMMKASKEAKLHTSWTEPDEVFETALKSFIRKVLANDVFLRSFVPFAREVHRLARMSCISHTILHIALPGVPDIYQGTEMWDLSLVDPDNRRQPNFAARKALLTKELKAGELLAAAESDTDGSSKMWTLRRMMQLRKQYQAVFEKGSYAPATIAGPASPRVIAFLRKHEETEMLVVVARFFGQQQQQQQQQQSGAATWEDTTLHVHPDSCWNEQLSGSSFSASNSGAINLSRLFASGPWAVLLRAK